MSADVRLHSEAFHSHSLAEWTKRRESIDARVVPLLPLQMAHLRHQRLCTANLHAVHYVRNLHWACLILQHHGKPPGHANQCIRFTIRSMMYITASSATANPPEYASTRISFQRGAIIPRCRAIS